MITLISSNVLHARSIAPASFRWPAAAERHKSWPAKTNSPPTPSVPFAGRAPCYRRSIDRISRSRTSPDDASDLFFHYHLQTWQHEAEAVHGLQGSHAYCNREGRRSALAVVALLDARRCLSSTTTRDRCAGRRFTCRRRNHDVHGRPRRTGHATNLHDSDGAAAAGRRGIDVKLLDAQVLPSRNTPCIVWNSIYLQRWVALEGVDLPAARGYVCADCYRQASKKTNDDYLATRVLYPGTRVASGARNGFCFRR